MVRYLLAAMLGIVVPSGVALALVQRLGAAGFGVCGFGAVGALVGVAIARCLESGALIGVISVAGGVLGALLGGNALGVTVIAGPTITLAGTVLGSSIWLATVVLPPPTRDIGSRIPQEEQGKARTSTRGHPRRYLLIAALSAVLGPILGACAFAVYYYSVGVHPFDRGYYFWVHVAVGTIGGLLVAVPYSAAWLIQLGRRPSRRSTTDRDT